MALYRFLILLSLTSFSQAGPLIGVLVDAVGVAIGEGAAAAVAGSTVAATCGVGASAIWYGSFVIVDGALYYGSAAAAGGAIAAGAAAAGALAKVTDKHKSEEIMASISSVSVHSVQSASSVSVSKASAASVASVASKASVASEDSVALKASGGFANSLLLGLESKASEALKSSEVQLLASKESAVLKSSQPLSANASPTGSVGPTNTISGAPTPQITSPMASSPIPPPPGQPVSTLPPSNRPQEVPAGVPDYNFRMCQYDIIKMGQNHQNLTFDNPTGYDLRVDNVPSTCMVLATVMLGDPSLGPHPVPMGAASLQWNDVKPDTINQIRQAFVNLDNDKCRDGEKFAFDENRGIEWAKRSSREFER